MLCIYVGINTLSCLQQNRTYKIRKPKRRAYFSLETKLCTINMRLFFRTSARSLSVLVGANRERIGSFFQEVRSLVGTENYIHPDGWTTSTTPRLNDPNFSEKKRFFYIAFLKLTGKVSIAADLHLNLISMPFPYLQ